MRYSPYTLDLQEKQRSISIGGSPCPYEPSTGLPAGSPRRVSTWTVVWEVEVSSTSYMRYSLYTLDLQEKYRSISIEGTPPHLTIEPSTGVPAGSPRRVSTWTMVWEVEVSNTSYMRYSPYTLDLQEKHRSISIGGIP